MKNKLSKIFFNIARVTKKQTVRLSALVIALSLIGGGTVFAIAEKVSGNDNSSVSQSASADKKENVKDKLDKMLDNLDADKKETVYVIAKADGTVKKVIVSEQLKNANGDKQVKDKTNLKNVENVKNNNSYKMDGDSYIWDAEGNDVYYQGTSDKQLPVDLSINFKLNGSDISPDELAGKSGKVDITFNYTNNESKIVKIDGKDEKIYVPFTMLSGMIFDNDKCKNITVSNGRVISDGNRSVAVGFAMPGMQQNLNLSKSTIDIPESVTVSADVTDFELDTTLTLASNDMLNSLDLDNVKDYDDLKDKLSTLESSTKQLMDGSSKLYGGISTLLEKSGDLVTGVQALAVGANALTNGAQSLYNGSNTLSDGANSLYGGASTLYGGTSSLSDGSSKLYSGASELSDGLGELSKNSGDLNNGAKQVFDTLLKTADDAIKSAGLSADKLTISNYSTVLNKLINSLDESTIKKVAYNTALKTVTDKVKANEPTIQAGVEKAVEQKVLEGVLKKVGLNMTAEQYETAKAAGQIDAQTSAKIDGAVKQQMASDQIKAQVKAAVAQQEQKLIDDNMNSTEVQSQINAAVEKAKNGQSSLQSLKNQLDSYNKFYTGLCTYTAGVDKAYSGSKELKNGTKDVKDGSSKLNSGSKELKDGSAKLKDGSSDLKDGAAQLYSGAKELLSGVLKLQDGSVTLISGVEKLNSGSKDLSDGMKKFYDEGIEKLMDTFNGDIDPVVTRLRATVDVSKEYDSYGGKADDMSSNTKFIYKTDGISKK